MVLMVHLDISFYKLSNLNQMSNVGKVNKWFF